MRGNGVQLILLFWFLLSLQHPEILHKRKGTTASNQADKLRGEFLHDSGPNFSLNLKLKDSCMLKFLTRRSDVSKRTDLLLHLLNLTLLTENGTCQQAVHVSLPPAKQWSVLHISS